MKSKEKKSYAASSAINGGTDKHDESSEMQYFINLDDEVWGPFTLSELKINYPILEDTLITTDTLDGMWYEARYFECFDDIFDTQQDFRINEFGEIVRLK